jgi:predicted acyltransferase (DUF342 family)
MIFTLVTLAIMFVPIIPALFEWLKPTDDKQLKIVQEFDSDTEHFAQGFADYIQKNFDGFIAENEKETNEDGVLKEGTGFTLLYSNEAQLSPRETKEKTLHRLLLAANDFELPSGISYHKEIYGKDSINSGENNNIRAVFAEKNLTIQKNTTIIRWAHAGDTLRTDGKCTLYGRVSAGNSIILSEHCSFERMRAPIIQFGEYSEKTAPKTPSPKLAINGLRALESLPNLKEQDGRRWLVSGNLEIAPNSLFNGDIIATGDVIIGAGSVINGSVKSNGTMWLKDFVQINGSAVSAEDLLIAEAVEITNPIIAEGKLTIGKNSIIGTSDQPTSVNAPIIHCYNGARIYGTIWAYNSGLMLADGEVRG